jgi:hypothetical protein
MNRLLLHPDDDVAVVVHADEDVPSGHKVAVGDIAAGQPVRKYGTLIGFASRRDPQLRRHPDLGEAR